MMQQSSASLAIGASSWKDQFVEAFSVEAGTGISHCTAKLNCRFTILDLSIYFAEGVNYEEIDAKDPDTLTEVEKVALLGRPCLGDITKIQIRIRENKEFKVSWSAAV